MTEPHDGAPGGRPAPGLDFSTPEVAWPASVVTGFAGAYVGLSFGVPLLGPVLALAFFAPVYTRLVRRGSTQLAGVVSIGWLFAVAAATTGGVFEEGFETVARGTLGAWRYRDAEISSWIRGRGPGSGVSHVLRNGAAVLALLLVARPTGGLVSLLGLGAGASLVGAGAGWFAQVATGAALGPLSGVPPQHVFTLIGTALLSAVLADRTPVLPVSRMASARRQVLFTGVGLAAAGVLLEPVLAPLWGRWVAGAVG